MQLHGIGDPPIDAELESKEQWISDAVAAFARQHGALEKFCGAKDNRPS